VEAFVKQFLYRLLSAQNSRRIRSLTWRALLSTRRCT